MPTLEYTYISSVKIWLRKLGSLGVLGLSLGCKVLFLSPPLGAMVKQNAMKKPASTKKPATKVKRWREDDVTDDEPSEFMDTSKRRKFESMW